MKKGLLIVLASLLLQLFLTLNVRAQGTQQPSADEKLEALPVAELRKDSELWTP